jgi:hypothetical protein
MAYNYLTQFDSPNYTPGSQTRAVWGRERKIEAIAIHWWGDPNLKPTFEGIVNYLCRANGSSSAHYVATGTDRRVACLVAPGDNSWATNSANPTTISIECDPRCRDEDYDVVAELIADIRDTYGDIPLVPHKQFVATACPGNYDLGRLDRMANTKVASAVQGQVRDMVPPIAKVTLDQADALYFEYLGRGIKADQSGINSYVGKITAQELKDILNKSTERSRYVNRLAAEQAAKVEAAKKEAEARAKREAEIEAIRISEEKKAQEAAKKAAEEAAAKSYTEADRKRDNATADILQAIWLAIVAFAQNIIKGVK